MHLKISGTVLLFIGAAHEHKVVWGTLGLDFELNISNFHMNDGIDDIRWESGKTRIAQLKGGKLKEVSGKYKILTNGALRIKQLKREDHDIYKVTIYDSIGKNLLTETFQLIIQGKSLFPKFLHPSLGAL